MAARGCSYLASKRTFARKLRSFQIRVELLHVATLFINCERIMSLKVLSEVWNPKNLDIRQQSTVKRTKNI